MLNEMTTSRLRVAHTLSILLLAWVFVTPLASADDTGAQQVFPTPMLQPAR